MVLVQGKWTKGDKMTQWQNDKGTTWQKRQDKKLESNQPKIFMRYLNVDRFSGRRRKKSWITWWERRYTTLGSVPRESIKLVYMCAKTAMELNWIEINMMKTTKPKHSIETGIYLYKCKDNHETMEWNWN